MQYQMHDFTYDDVRSASSNYLRSCLKEDISPELHDMMAKELYVENLGEIANTKCSTKEAI